MRVKNDFTNNTRIPRMETNGHERPYPIVVVVTNINHTDPEKLIFHERI
jgi:hypothetical protein